MLAISYVQCSVAVGLAQIVDGIYLFRNGGNINKGVALFAALEYFWAAVSYVELHGHRLETPPWLPLSFIGWIVVGTLLGMTYNARRRKDGRPPIVPRFGVIVGGLFGLYFSSVSLWLSL